jgi:hypothetical protein
MKSAWLVGAISAVVGGAAGLLGGAYALHASKPAPEVRIIEQRQEKAGWAGLGSDSPRRASEQPLPAASAPATGDARVAERAEPQPPPSHEELKRDWHRHFAERVQAASSEARDPSWAREVEHAFQSDFDQGRDRMQAELIRVDCKTSKCLAQVKWPSYRVARSRFPQIMHAAYTTNCAVAVDIGEEPAKPDEPHQAAVVFECERAGARGSNGG